MRYDFDRISLKCTPEPCSELIKTRKRLEEVTHTLNDLYEVVFNFYYIEYNPVNVDIEEALTKADGILQGN
jgi:hypothetical protein